MSFVRVSKFRHVFGSLGKKDFHYDGTKSTTAMSAESQIIKVNNKWIAYIYQAGGGGAVNVFPIGNFGRQPTAVGLLTGHTAPVTDLDWNPANSDVLATASDDGAVRLWNIPTSGVPNEGISEASAILKGHQRKVNEIYWNPNAKDILGSSSQDNTIKLWDLTAQKQAYEIKIKDQIQSWVWNQGGNLIATQARDKRIRLFDARQGTSPILDIISHPGGKPAKVLFANDKNWLISTGFGKGSDRQILVWDLKSPEKPIATHVMDQSSGVQYPFFDEGTQILYVGSKGEASIKYFEIVPEAPFVYHISTFGEGVGMRGLTLLPKIYQNVLGCEVAKFYKLTSKDTIEPISFVVPRRSEMFQDDLYPPSPDTTTPANTAEEWIKGSNKKQRNFTFSETGDLKFIAADGSITTEVKSFISTAQAPSKTPVSSRPASPPPETKEQKIAKVEAAIAAKEKEIEILKAELSALNG